MASAVIVAAGQGARMGGAAGARGKAYIDLAGAPALAWAVRAFEQAPEVGEIVVVVGAGGVARCLRDVVGRFSFGKVAKVVEGGPDRQASAAIGARATDARYPVIAVHDGARPFVGGEAIREGVLAAARDGASVVAVPVTDTVKSASGGRVAATLDRGALWAAQTPQSFRRGLLLECLGRAEREGFKATDDAQLAERCGAAVAVVMGDYGNIKLTTPDDLAFAQALIGLRRLSPPKPAP